MSTGADTRPQVVKRLSERPLTERQTQVLVNIFHFWHDRLDNKTGKGKCLPYDDIRKHLHFRDTKQLLETGFLKATGWSHADHQQRAWTLTPLGLAAVEAIHDAPPEPTPPPPKNKGGRPRTRAVNRHGKRGNRAPDVAVTRAPELNIEHAQQTLNHASDLSDCTRAQLHAAIEGSISHDYRQTTTGRLQGQGRHLQSFTKQAIAALFPDCYDVDIENCHVVILQHLARQHGINDTPTLDDYANNKRRWRTTIAKHCNADVKAIKQCLLSLIYSAMITGSDKTAIVETLGKNAANRFVNHPDVIELHAELAYITRIVVKASRATANRQGNIYNAAGVAIHKSELPKKIMAHIAQGIESMLMQLVTQKISVVEVWKHDGAIVRKLISDDGLQSVCDHVAKKTGFQISLEIEPLNAGWQAVQQYGTTTANALLSADSSISSLLNNCESKKSVEQGGREAEQEKGQAQAQEQRPLTEHSATKPAYTLRLRLVSFGFVQSEKQADSSHVSPRYDDAALEHQRAPP